MITRYTHLGCDEHEILVSIYDRHFWNLRDRGRVTDQDEVNLHFPIIGDGASAVRRLGTGEVEDHFRGLRFALHSHI
jgi:hypothetical protein